LSLDQADREYLAQCLTAPGDEGPTLKALRQLPDNELLGFGLNMRHARRMALDADNETVAGVFGCLLVVTERALAERAVFPPELDQDLDEPVTAQQ
jgi:hypothetical protein